MNIYESLIHQHAPKPLIQRAREENEYTRKSINHRIVHAWGSMIAIGVSGQCALLAASWLAAEVGHWINREEFAKQFDREACVKMIGTNEAWAIDIIAAWMRV